MDVYVQSSGPAGSGEVACVSVDEVCSKYGFVSKCAVALGVPLPYVSHIVCGGVTDAVEFSWGSAPMRSTDICEGDTVLLICNVTTPNIIGLGEFCDAFSPTHQYDTASPDTVRFLLNTTMSHIASQSNSTVAFFRDTRSLLLSHQSGFCNDLVEQCCAEGYKVFFSAYEPAGCDLLDVKRQAVQVRYLQGVHIVLRAEGRPPITEVEVEAVPNVVGSVNTVESVVRRFRIVKEGVSVLVNVVSCSSEERNRPLNGSQFTHIHRLFSLWWKPNKFIPWRDSPLLLCLKETMSHGCGASFVYSPSYEDSPYTRMVKKTWGKKREEEQS